jgi:cytochrome c oxidase assembly protein subunit 15
MVAILRNKRRDLRTLGLVQILGILAQGVLGGITVLTGLNPATVSAHFLLSIVLIAAALSLRQRAHGVTPTNIKLAPLTRRLARATVTLTALVIFAGTIVTGSGPHAGDDLAERFNLDPRMMSWIHADLVIALIGVTVALLIAIRLGEAEDTRSSWGVSARNFLIICLAQGLIGYTQYFTGLPELLVGFHILGSVLVWLTVWNLTIKGNVLSRS